MMKILKYLMLMGVMLLTSCEKFLDTEPRDFFGDSDMLDSESNLERAVRGVYKTLGTPSLYGRFLYHHSGACADEVWDIQVNNSTNTYLNNSVQGYSHNTATPLIYNFWKDLYIGIQRANHLLANLSSSLVADDIKNVAEGEVLFLRSYFYFLLVAYYGDVPLITEENYQEDFYSFTRTPSIEVYERIVADMERAEQLVPAISEIGFGGRVSKSAVQGLLARVYLQWAGYPLKDESKYQNARDWAEKVINSGEHALNPSYQQVFVNYAQNLYDIKESIFEVEFSVENAALYRAYGELGNRNGIGGVDANTTMGYLRVTGRLWNFFKEGDKRRDWVIADYIYDGAFDKKRYLPTTTIRDIYSLRPGKWRREYELERPNSVATPQNFPVLRYADVLLMFAEADNAIHDGPSKTGMDYVNLVRRRGYGISSTDMDEITEADLNYMDYNKKQFVDVLLYQERSRELSFEGWRHLDLVRWGRLISTIRDLSDEYVQDGLPNSKAIVRSLNISPRHVLFPIPQMEVSLNRNLLPNNDGWE